MMGLMCPYAAGQRARRVRGGRDHHETRPDYLRTVHRPPGGDGDARGVTRKRAGRRRGWGLFVEHSVGWFFFFFLLFSKGFFGLLDAFLFHRHFIVCHVDVWMRRRVDACFAPRHVSMT